MIDRALRRFLLGVLVVAAGGCLGSAPGFAAEPGRRVLFDFETTGPAAEWVASGEIAATRKAVPDADGLAALRPAGQGLATQTDQGGGVYCPSGGVPQDWRWFRELTFWVYRSPSEAARRPRSTLEVRVLEAGGKAGFWRRVDVDHSGWKEIALPLRWFRWNAGRTPRWDRVDRLGLHFRNGADLVVDTIALTLGQPGRATGADLTADDLLEVGFPDAPRRPRVFFGDRVTVISDVERVDAAALAGRLADVANAVQRDFPFLEKPSVAPILVLFPSRAAYEAFRSRFVQQLGAVAPESSAKAWSGYGVAATFWDENTAAPSAEHVAALVDCLVTLSARLNGPGDWLHAGASGLYQRQFYPQEDFGELVRLGLQGAGAQTSLAGLCTGGKIAADQEWQATTLVDMLRTQSRYRAAAPKLFEALREAGSTDLAPHLPTILGTDWEGLSADWQAYCRRTYVPGAMEIVSPTVPEDGTGGRPLPGLRTAQVPVSVGWKEGWAVYRYSPEKKAWESFVSPATPLPPLGIVGVGSAAAALDPYEGFSGWHLDLSTLRWRPIPASPITPFARKGDLVHGFEQTSPDSVGKFPVAEVPVVFAGDRMVVLVHSPSKTVHGAIFDTRTWRWTGMPDPPIAPRFRYPNAVVGNQFVIWGGYPNYPQDGAVFDLDRRVWSKIPAAPVEFVYGMVHATWRDRLVVVAGKLDDAEYAGATYDPATQVWATIPRPDFDLGEYIACAVSGDELFLWSGKVMDRGGALFNFQTGQWRKVADAPIPARSLACALPAGGKIYVWGGWTAHGPSRTDGAVYDLASDSWEKLPDMPGSVPQALHPGW